MKAEHEAAYVWRERALFERASNLFFFDSLRFSSESASDLSVRESSMDGPTVLSGLRSLSAVLLFLMPLGCTAFGRAQQAAIPAAPVRSINQPAGKLVSAQGESKSIQLERAARVQEAGKLAQKGEYAKALVVYREIYGTTPPPGDVALSYYETEAATDGGRPHALAGLLALSGSNPSDARYEIARGRLLTYDPQTRSEGRKLLALHPQDRKAVEAVRQSLLWDAQNASVANEIRSYLLHHNDAQLTRALREQKESAAAETALPLKTEEQKTAQVVESILGGEDEALKRARDAKHLVELQQHLQTILAAHPEDPDALAAMGYLHLQQADFGGATSFLLQAKQHGSKDLGIEDALAASRFGATLGQGADALRENDLALSEKQYRAALAMRPTSTEALDGLGRTLLNAKQPAAAVPYFAQFLRLKASAESAWRGLFLAELGAGDALRALQMQRQAPPTIRAELARDPVFLLGLASAYASVGRNTDALQATRGALELPLSADAQGLETALRLRNAGLYEQAHQLGKAADEYRQILAKDGNSIPAWQGLVHAEHKLNLDTQALQTLASMPLPIYEDTTRDPGFKATVASIYQSQKSVDLAKTSLEKGNLRRPFEDLKPLPKPSPSLGAAADRSKEHQDQGSHSHAMSPPSATLLKDRKSEDLTHASDPKVSEIDVTSAHTLFITSVAAIPPVQPVSLKAEKTQSTVSPRILRVEGLEHAPGLSRAKAVSSDFLVKTAPRNPEETFGPYVPLVPPAKPGSLPKELLSSGLPSPPTLQKTIPAKGSKPDAGAKLKSSLSPNDPVPQAALIQKSQTSPSLTGESKPPTEDYSTPALDGGPAPGTP